MGGAYELRKPRTWDIMCVCVCVCVCVYGWLV